MPVEIEFTFAPINGRSVTRATLPIMDGTASSSGRLAVANDPSAAVAAINDYVRITNSGDADIYVAVGPSHAPRSPTDGEKDVCGCCYGSGRTKRRA